MYYIKHVNRRKHFLRLKVQIIYGNIAAIFNKYIMYPTSETQMWVTSVVCMNEQEIICITIYGYSVYNIVRHILTYKGKITKKKKTYNTTTLLRTITFFSYFLSKFTDI